jgi:hypothetical protein
VNSRTSRLLPLTLVALGTAPFVASRAETTPAQPIAFSHRIHAQDNAIPCLYCHAYARRGPVAGLPSLQRCVGCHAQVAKDKPEVVKLMGYWSRREPIPWQRVHDLPDYVRFNHKRHVLAEVDCRECHGEVRQMEAATQVASLEMGFCLACHKRRGASTDCLTCHH